MDPTANLAEQLSIAAHIIATLDAGEVVDVDDTYRLAELVESLNRWLHVGGHLPVGWATARVPIS